MTALPAFPSSPVVVITGASSGLGDATARLLAARGARLVLAARRTDRLDALAAELRSGGAQAIAVACDVTRVSAVEALAQAAVERFGRIDVWVNNAGIMPLSPLAERRIDEWDATIDVNLKGVLYGIAAALPVFQAQASGHFINIASVAGLKVFSPIGSVYSATKFAVRALSEGLRAEVGPTIRTTTISPGAVESELQTHSTHAPTAQAVQAFYKANQIGPDAVARAIAFAIEQPAEVDINEIVLRPTAQEF